MYKEKNSNIQGLQFISKQLELQLRSFWIDIDFSEIEEKIDTAYKRCMVAISSSKDKYLNPNGTPIFSLYHSECWSLLRKWFK